MYLFNVARVEKKITEKHTHARTPTKQTKIIKKSRRRCRRAIQNDLAMKM